MSAEHPDPAICRHVLAAAPEWSDVTDSTGEVEMASVMLKPASLSMEPFEEVHAWLADVEGQAMKIEEMLAYL